MMASRSFFKDCGSLTDIFWLTDKESGKFKGCGFLTFESVEQGTAAYGKNGEELLGRPIKIDFCKPRPEKAGGGGKGGKKKFETRALSERPDNCTTVFCGNLSFDIDEDAMYKFAEGCGEITQIRWLSHKDSGDFKGCGFVEFDSPESVDLFVKKNGETCMGRPMHIDYAAPRPPRQ
jgi:nucleolin